MLKAKSVDEFIQGQKIYKEEVLVLREILLNSELEEYIKWYMPVYTLNGKNILGMYTTKSYFGLWFYQGVFLSDPLNVLINAQEGKTEGLRQWRMTSLQEINSENIQTYVNEAIENQRAGLIYKPGKKTTILPPLLENALESSPKLMEQFESLSPYKQRDFCAYISAAKLKETKDNRMKKILPMILQGVGLNDKYQK